MLVAGPSDHAAKSKIDVGILAALIDTPALWHLGTVFTCGVQLALYIQTMFRTDQYARRYLWRRSNHGYLQTCSPGSMHDASSTCRMSTCRWHVSWG